jgi:PhnB protein
VTTVNTYLNFDGNAAEAFTYYKSVFGGDFTSMVRFKDMPMEGADMSPQDAEKVMHVGLPIGPNNVLMASDVLESMGNRLVPGNNVYVSVHPSSREEADRIFNALADGGDVEMPIADQFWGDYYGSLKDRFGVHWMVNYAPETR